MDPRERINDFRTALLAALQGWQTTNIWTALPAYVVSYDATKQTISAQVTITFPVTNAQNVTVPVKMTVIPDIPVVFPSGGGFTLTFPIKANDECLLVFSARCIDGWFALGGVQNQVEPRMHDLSDGFALVGPKSLPHALSGVSTNAVELRSNDGSAKIQIDAIKNVNVITPGVMNITAPGGVIINGTPLSVP
jgi:hypothetical protein